ncbi:MAG: PVC-type heme-binding CxxCH protein [Planctomycetota bacterium]
MREARRCFGNVVFWIAVVSTLTFSPALAADPLNVDPLPPQVAEASAEAIDSMNNIRLREGWSIELLAAEPEVANIVAFDLDRKGRLFVCETFRQNRGVTDNRGHDKEWLKADLASQTVQDRIDYHKRLLGDAAITYAQHDDRIRRLVDTDGDFKFDVSSVLANGFNGLEEGTGAGVLAIGDSVYYTCIPKLWKLTDADDDGVAENRVVLSDGYGVRVAFRGHDSHGLTMGPDGRLYFSIGDRGYHITTDDGRVLANASSGAVFRCEPDGSDLTVIATGLRNPQELAFNEVGDLFSVDNNSDSGDQARIVQILRGGDSGWRMNYQYLPDRGIFNRESIWKPLSSEQTVSIVPPIKNFTDGPSGLAYYPGTGFGESLRDHFLICDFRGGPANSGVRSFRLETDGAYYSVAEDDQPIWQSLITDIAFGPDGGLYVSDWVNGWDGLGKGRVYRITSDADSGDPIVAQVRAMLAEDESTLPADELVTRLGHQDRRIRLQAQFELARRDEVDRLLKTALNVDNQRLPRLHAIWGLGQIARRDPGHRSRLAGQMTALLADNAVEVRRSACLHLGEYGDASSDAALEKCLADESPRVVYSALQSAVLRKIDAFAGTAVSIADSAAKRDPALRHAVIYYLAKTQSPENLLQMVSKQSAFGRRLIVAALRRQDSGRILELLSDDDPLVVREAVRAIHDSTIQAAYPALAALCSRPGVLARLDDEAIRRIISTNDRLRDADSAKRLGELACLPGLSEQRRIEALNILGSWAESVDIDRYDHAFRPIQAGKMSDAAAAVRAKLDLLMASTDAIRGAAVEAASRLGVREIAPQLASRVNDESASPKLRAKSLEALERLDAKLALEKAAQVKPSQGGILFRVALRILSRQAPDKSMATLIQATESNQAKTRALAWDLIALRKTPEVTAALESAVLAYTEGTLPKDVELNVIQAARDRGDAATKQRLESHLASLQQNDPLGAYLPSLHGGDVEAGRKLFFEKTELSCVRCHKVNRSGGEVGPVLTTIGKDRDRRYLLEAITMPNAAIAKGYETAVVQTEWGDTLTGIVASENEDELTLVQADGSQVTIDPNEIIGRKKGKSSMPADLVKLMTPRELRDLVAYLDSLKVDPRAGSNEVE